MTEDYNILRYYLKLRKIGTCIIILDHQMFGILMVLTSDLIAFDLGVYYLLIIKTL